MEPAEETIMKRPPRRKGKRLFGKLVMWNCLWYARYLTLISASARNRDHPVLTERVAVPGSRR
eukprot:2984265-Rhodomonas_salina.1